MQSLRNVIARTLIDFQPEPPTTWKQLRDALDTAHAIAWDVRCYADFHGLDGVQP